MLHKQLFKAIALAALASAAHVSQAAVLTFDDLIGTGPFGPSYDYFKADYNGFRFGNNSTLTNTWGHTDESLFPDPAYTPLSGSRYATTCFPDPLDPAFCSHTGGPDEATLPITSAVAFIFNGAYFSGYDPIRYDLYIGGVTGTKVYTSGFSAALEAGGIGAITYVASGYNGLVDTVVVRGTQGNFAMDDFTYNVTAVPEPGSLALVALAGLLAAAQRRKASLSGK